MYLKLTKGSSNWSYEGDQIKELSFTPEYDPTLSTYPIGEYDATIYDTQRNANDLKGATVDLYGVQPTGSSDYTSLLAAYYKITKTKDIGNNLIHIKAQSILSEFDDVWMHGHYYNDTIDDIVDEIFTAVGYYFSSKPYYIWPVISGYTINAYLDSQTARERLIWCVQACSGTILQWGEYSRYGLCIAKAIDAESDTDYANRSVGTLLYENTYKKPIVKEKQTPGSYTIISYNQWSYNQPGTEGWDNILTGYTYDLDTADRHPEYMYYYSSTTTLTNPSNNDTTEASLKGNLAVKSTYYLRYIARAYFRDKTTELDMLISDRNFQKYMPREKVRFYADQSTMYTGVIRSAQFISGQFTRVKLVIDTDSTPVSLVHVRFNYVYTEGQDSRALGHRDYYVVPGNYMTVDHPTFKSYVVDRWETFTPQTASTTIQPSQNTTTTINYSRS